MSGSQGSKWSNVKNIQTVLRSFQVNQDEGQTRGWEPHRKDDHPTALDPPPPTRPAYGYSQHYFSDPGPHSGPVPWQNSPPVPPPGTLHNQNCQGQYHPGSSAHGYPAFPAPNTYQPTHPQAYGQNQGYHHHTPPPLQPPYPAHQQQQAASWVDQHHQSRQGAHSYAYNHNSYQPAGNAYSPPLPLRPDSQAAQGPSQSPSHAGPSYPTQSYGGSLGRAATAPTHCKHRDPGKGICRDCERQYGYTADR